MVSDMFTAGAIILANIFVTFRWRLGHQPVDRHYERSLKKLQQLLARPLETFWM